MLRDIGALFFHFAEQKHSISTNSSLNYCTGMDNKFYFVTMFFDFQLFFTSDHYGQSITIVNCCWCGCFYS